MNLSTVSRALLEYLAGAPRLITLLNEKVFTKEIKFSKYIPIKNRLMFGNRGPLKVKSPSAPGKMLIWKC